VFDVTRRLCSLKTAACWSWGGFELFGVMQLAPQGFHYQSGQSVRTSIHRQNLVQAHRVMPSSYRDRTGQAHESPDIPHSFVCRWEGCECKKCPESRN
jgi:hypothetical protein